jgi:predicted SAM-dependent methyltransferase
MKKTPKLNVGGGFVRRHDTTNMDAVKNPFVDVVHNMDVFPWPFADNSFDKINFSHVLEHSRNIHGVLNECWRVCKDGGRIKILAPYPTGSTQKIDFTHYSQIWHKSFNNYSLENFSAHKNTYPYGAVFRIKKRHFIGHFNSRILNFITLPFLWNRMPKIYEATLLCYIFPMDGIEIELEPVKTEEVKKIRRETFEKSVFYRR